MSKPIILVTNDDGIAAPGIRELILIMKEIGTVYVVAPDKPQSGMGHAVTINSTLRVEEIYSDNSSFEWACSGTPADCVKLAVNKILPKKPDLCVSGINHGSNSSINILYSGTMSAAIEAGIEGIPAIGFSLCDYSHNANFKAASNYIKSIALNVLKEGLPKDIVLNVNIPKADEKEIQGVKICKQARAYWEEEFLKRVDPRGQNYYWLTGSWKNKNYENGTDEEALSENYISIVPVQFDLTAYSFIDTIKNWNFSI
ncbi:5'/3'-nucleotidase SurE [Apibacter muscae]|uniref:5'/3'-nucleotidase SurE n=1 Tax=Apibacter muscae TaxID=2509004 RepID=UPI0011ADF3AA|nr:5'/3'-nucleotidase SurE [Apibacter muscae]TWP27943.1 5'/3'-nucleotidase SurE [Apibacter muscae]